jgi:hypothetical protein
MERRVVVGGDITDKVRGGDQVVGAGCKLPGDQQPGHEGADPLGQGELLGQRQRRPVGGQADSSAERLGAPQPLGSDAQAGGGQRAGEGQRLLLG